MAYGFNKFNTLVVHPRVDMWVHQHDSEFRPESMSPASLFLISEPTTRKTLNSVPNEITTLPIKEARVDQVPS